MRPFNEHQQFLTCRAFLSSNEMHPLTHYANADDWAIEFDDCIVLVHALFPLFNDYFIVSAVASAAKPKGLIPRQFRPSLAKTGTDQEQRIGTCMCFTRRGQQHTGGAHDVQIAQ